MRVVLLAGAKRELFQAATWYDDRRPGLGDALLGEAASAVDRLKAFPDTGIAASHGYKRCVIRRFPYSLIYRASADTLIVVAFVHRRRRPLVWLRRARREDQSN